MAEEKSSVLDSVADGARCVHDDGDGLVVVNVGFLVDDGDGAEKQVADVGQHGGAARKMGHAESC